MLRSLYRGPAAWHFATDELPKEERGDLFGVARHYFRRVKTDRDTVLQPLAEGDLLHPGDEVEIHLTIRSKSPAEYVHLRDPRPAGLEPGPAVSGYHFDLGLIWYEETRDSGTNKAVKVEASNSRSRESPPLMHAALALRLSV